MIDKADPIEAESDAQLIESAQAGDSEAFGRLMSMYEDDIYRSFFIAFGGNREMAADVCQDVFKEATANFDRFAGLNFRNWLMQIARRLSEKAREKYFKERMISLDGIAATNDDHSFQSFQSDEPQPESRLAGVEFDSKLSDALAQLTEKQRQTFQVVVVDGNTYEEAKKLLGVSSNGTIANNLRRAKRDLALAMAEPN